MAKAPKKKSAKEGSNLFHSNMKASVNVDRDTKGNGATEWINFDHSITGRLYVIRYFYEVGDKQRRGTVSLVSNNPQKPEELLIRSFNYSAERQEIDINEQAKMIAMDHGNMQSLDNLI